MAAVTVVGFIVSLLKGYAFSEAAGGIHKRREYRIRRARGLEGRMLTDEHLRAPLNPKAPPMAGTSTVDKSGGFTSLTSLPGGDRSFVGR